MTTKVIVFTGPTMKAEEVVEILDATVLGPAALGDLLAAARSSPAAIGLIDGYFERVPAVWHKEILWAMSRGIRVYGAASMGALRAAELAPFGMVGVGRIFEAFHDGLLEADDEVAVRHAPAEEGYRPMSEALVDIRATLQAAAQANVVSDGVAAALIDVAAELYYTDRIYPRVFESAIRRVVDREAVERLERWLPTGRVSQKRIDAGSMLRLIADDLRADPRPVVRANFVSTSYWEVTCRELDLRPHPLLQAQEPDLESVVGELRLDPKRYDLLRRASLARAARRLGWSATPSRTEIAASDEMRRVRIGLAAETSLGTPEGRCTALGVEDAELDRLAYEQRAQLDSWIYDELRHVGCLPALASRAHDKQRMLEVHQLADATRRTLGLDRATLVEDHCYACGIRIAPSADLLARAVDLPGATELERLLIAERGYQRIMRGERWR